MLPGMEESVAKSMTSAVDLAKSVFEIAVSARPGRVASRHRLSRTQLLHPFAQRPAATVLLEACGSAHYGAREIEALARENARAARSADSAPSANGATAT